MSKRRGRKRVVTSLAESKTLALYREGRQLFGHNDFEQVSISQVSRAAGISVGAFYVRFSDKDAFLDFVIANTFAQAGSVFRERADDRYVPNLADVLINQFSDPEFSGIVRAAVKLGFTEARHRHPFDEYREYVSQHLTELLLPDLKKGERLQRIAAINSALAILTHAASLPDTEINLGEIETQQIIIELLSGKAVSGKPPPNKKRSTEPSPKKETRTPRDPESLRKPIADKMKPMGSRKGPQKI